MTTIQTKLRLIEYITLNEYDLDKKKLKAIIAIKNLLNHIDFSAEILPLENTKKLINLLESINNKPLTSDEIIVIKELVCF